MPLRSTTRTSVPSSQQTKPSNTEGYQKKIAIAIRTGAGLRSGPLVPSGAPACPGGRTDCRSTPARRGSPRRRCAGHRCWSGEMRRRLQPERPDQVEAAADQQRRDQDDPYPGQPAGKIFLPAPAPFEPLFDRSRDPVAGENEEQDDRGVREAGDEIADLGPERRVAMIVGDGEMPGVRERDDRGQHESAASI
ncbi:hypothetical protein DdX_21457 [Ditylenchus destructor]|uniref:Uncharacterized protein n=1 Tax=Ditylenchus destructor TaxID=166010 RepID=A0AAD4MJ17_9BILA|nr:hypothetical protein DdX_21457 [Ditylenchus destructor]